MMSKTEFISAAKTGTRTCAAFLAVALLALASMARAEVIAVEQIDKGFFISDKPSLTMYWKARDSKAVLVFIPGGEGYIGLKPGQTDQRYQFHQMLKRLTDPATSGGKVDIVLLDSPEPLSPRQPYPAARSGSDHLTRIESTVRHYKEKTGLPVWLIGHSNGGISLMEFVKHMQKESRLSLVSGIIASGIRSESRFSAPLAVPMLFMHHKQDGCTSTFGGSAYEMFKKVREFNQAETAFAWINAGEAEPNDPCRSGFHMYFGASDEAAKTIEGFMAKFY